MCDIPLILFCFFFFFRADNYCYDDGIKLDPIQIHSYLTRVCYNRRSKIDPFYNQFIVGGISSNKTYLGYTDLLCTTFVDNFVATGFDAHFALPLLRNGYKKYGPNITIKEARNLLADTMRVLFYF